MNGPSRSFREAIREVFDGVEMVLHCGDYVSPAVLHMLEEECWELVGVAGNMDSMEIHRNLPATRRVHVRDKVIGLVHGWGSPQGIEKRVAGAFENVQGVVFGHSHRPYWGSVGDVWLFNPGPACGWGSPLGPSVGILEIGDQDRGHVLALKSG
jgi:hypothetical protein